jgi:putative ABC transport system substrate-binding protein
MRIQTLGSLGICALSMLMTPLTAEAQPPTKVPRIGWLHPGLSRPAPYPSLEAFRQGLRARGHVEGQDIVIEYRFAERSDERLADLAAELVRL